MLAIRLTVWGLLQPYSNVIVDRKRLLFWIWGEE